jgi:hypothetical protein
MSKNTLKPRYFVIINLNVQLDLSIDRQVLYAAQELHMDHHRHHLNPVAGSSPLLTQKGQQYASSRPQLPTLDAPYNLYLNRNQDGMVRYGLSQCPQRLVMARLGL